MSCCFLLKSSRVWVRRYEVTVWRWWFIVLYGGWVIVDLSLIKETSQYQGRWWMNYRKLVVSLPKESFMMTSSNGHIFRITCRLWGESTGQRHWSPVDSPHKGHWRGALMVSLLNEQLQSDAGDLGRHRTHYYVTVEIPHSCTKPSIYDTYHISRIYSMGVTPVILWRIHIDFPGGK